MIPQVRPKCRARALKTVMKASAAYGEELVALVELDLEVGLRLGELLNSRWAGVDEINQCTFIMQTENDKPSVGFAPHGGLTPTPVFETLKSGQYRLYSRKKDPKTGNYGSQMDATSLEFTQ